MKLREFFLREYIRSILLEYTPQQNVTLYHRSPHNFKVGDVIKPLVANKKGVDVRTSKAVEIALEKYRAEHHPEIPSRFNCVYLSYVPRSRFLYKGKLYAVKPVGKLFSTDSHLIDQLHGRYRETYSYGGKVEQPYVDYEDDLIVQYWEGVEPTRTNLKDLEVLAGSAIVTEVIEEKSRLHRGDNFVLDDVSIRCKLDAHYEIGVGSYTYMSDGNQRISTKVALSMLNKVNTIQVGDLTRNQYGDVEYPLTLLPGFKGTITIKSAPEPGQNFGPGGVKIWISPMDINVSIRIDEPNQFLAALKNGKIRRI